jgi:hypothetical protein
MAIQISVIPEWQLVDRIRTGLQFPTFLSKSDVTSAFCPTHELVDLQAGSSGFTDSTC